MFEANERFREWIDTKNLTPYRISKVTGYDKSNLSRIINDKTLIHSKLLQLLYEHYDAPVFWILTGDDMNELRDIPILSLFHKLNDRYRDYAVLEMDKLYKMQLIDEDNEDMKNSQ